MKNTAIILASGAGSRFGSEIPKQFIKLNDKTILEYSISAFEQNDNINEIIVVSNPDFIEDTKNIIQNKYRKVTSVISGGKTRRQSSYIGVNHIKEKDINVLIHDGARPFVSQKIINECIDALKTYKAVNVAVDSSDTIVEVDSKNIIKSMPVRKSLRRCQTPQCFRLEIIKKAHELAEKNKLEDITDDCGIVLKYNLADIYTVDGSVDNIKITYPKDIELAKLIINEQK